MNLKEPKISIVIPNLNNGDFIEETILSVLEQDYPNFELIIIDGGSQDNSIEIIKKHEHHLAHWVSEPDRGQAHAINKGLKIASGDLFDWMNSDDLIAPGTFKKVAAAFMQNPQAHIVCGYMTCFSGQDFHPPVRMKKYVNLEKTLIYGSMSAPSMYFRLDKFKEVGKLEERLHYCFDLEFWCRFLEKFDLEKLIFIEENLSFFRLHPNSKTVGEFRKFGEEQMLINYSIIQSFPNKNHHTLSPEQLGIKTKYHRDWNFTNLSPHIFNALSIQRTVELLHSHISFYGIMKWFLRSFTMHPANRGWRFYLMPLRALRWKVLEMIGMSSNWVTNYNKSDRPNDF